MKKLLISISALFIAILLNPLMAQVKTIPFDAEAKKIKFQQVIEEEGTQAELF